MLVLNAEKRDIFGKTLKKKQVRQEGKMPVVIYGPKEKAASFFVPMGDFKKTLHEAGESTVITLKTDKEEKEVLIQEVAYDPVSNEPVHADFYVIEKGKKVTVNVPLEFEGTAPAIKELGGVLVKVLHEVSVEAAPKDLPHDIKVDATKLTDLDSQVLVSDLPVPAGVEIQNGQEEVVASVDVVKEEEEEVVTPDLESIEVEQKGKKEEGEGEGESGESAETEKKE